MSISIIKYENKKTVSEEIVSDAVANNASLIKYIGIDENNKLTTGQTTPSSSSNKAFGDTHITTQSSTIHGFAVGVPFEIGSISGMTWFPNNLNMFESPSNCRLKYKGTTTKVFLILFSLHAQMSSTLVSTGLITLQKNGLSIPPSNTFITPYTISTTQYRSVNFHTLTSLSLNDELSVWLTFQGVAATMLLQDCNFTVIEL